LQLRLIFNINPPITDIYVKHLCQKTPKMANPANKGMNFFTIEKEIHGMGSTGHDYH
jgi:hypothetical protein